MAWADTEAAIQAFGRGESVIVVDSPERKDECYLVFAADHATADRMAFAIRHSAGIVYVASDKERFEHFGLHSATRSSTDRFHTSAHVSTTYLPGSSTGLSAADRATTARALCNLSNRPEEFSKPGHMFPVAAAAGGVLERAGCTEAAYDMSRLSGRAPVACLCELTSDDGTVIRRQDVAAFAKSNGMLAITIEQLIDHRKRRPELPGAAYPNTGGGRSLRGLDLPSFDGQGLKIGIVSARWNAKVCESLVDAARKALESCNVQDITVEYVAGSYEVPVAAQAMLETGAYDGLICVGCLIKGETMHFEYVNEAVSQGIMRLNLDYKVPVVYGILSVLNEDQAKARAGLSGNGFNIGKEWGITCVESCLLRKRYRRHSRL